MNRSELKVNAKQQISGNILMFLVCTLIVAALTSVASIVPVVGNLLVIGPLTLGTAKVVLSMTKGNGVQFDDLFSGFSQFGQSVILYLMIAIFTFLWSLLFFIPGIIKGLSYSMAYYILAENPNMTASEALDESKRITTGYKGDLFILQLSFIPWFLLCGITFGIAAIYVLPYMQTTLANFYHSIKNN